MEILKKKKEKTLIFLKNIKDKILSFWNWEKTNPIIWLVKLLIMSVTGLLVYILIKYILQPLLIVGILVIIYNLDRTSSMTTPTNSQTDHCSVSCNLLFTILHEHFTKLHVEKPCNISEIIPVQYPCYHTKNLIPFYRFIVLKASDDSMDMLNMKTLLNHLICQKLQAGFADVVEPFYYDFPTYYIIDIGDDSVHAGYIFVDIMPIIDDNSYGFAMKQSQSDRMDSMAYVAVPPKDEDF